MTTTKVFETSVTVNNISIQDYTHPDDHIPPTYDIAPWGLGGWVIGSVGR